MEVLAAYWRADVLIDKQFAQSTTQLFDHLGRAYKTLLPDGSSTQIGFDQWGNTISETDAAGHTKLNQFDSNGRLIAVTLPTVLDPLDSDGDGTTGLDAPRFDYAYDWSGNQTVLQDSLGRRTIFTFDSAGRQLSRTLPMGQQEFFTYNDLGQQVTHTSFEGIVTESIYDNGTTNVPSSHANYRVGSGRLIEQRFYASNADFNNGPSSAKEVWRFSYDAFGRKLSVERLARSTPGGALTQSRIERWYYDVLGRLIQEATPEGTINYAFNPVTGQKIRMWTTKAAGLAAANLADAVEDTRYSYNELGWLTGVTVVEKNDSPLPMANHEKTSYGHDLQGRQLRVDLPNGVIQRTEVNKLGAITRMRHYAPDKTPYDLGDNSLRDEFVYTLDAGGQRTRLAETFWFDADNDPQTPDVPKSTTYDWLYDADSRMTQETIDSFDNSVDRTDTFTMDLFGNRLKRTTNLASTPNLVDQVITYHYDANDRILDELLDNDNNGSTDQTTTHGWNVTQQASKTVTASGATQSTQTFSYDLQGRLATVINTKPGTPSSRVDYAYDSTGIRISATEYADSNDNGAFEPGERSNSTEYFIDHNNFTGYAQTIVETTKNAAGQPTKRIAYTFGTDELTQTTVTYDSSGVASPTTSLTFGHDAHGSVRVLFDATSAIAQAYTYAAYGELLAIHNQLAQAVGIIGSPGLATSALTSMLYNGESFDSRIGQLYLRARWYDGHRFTTIDPYSGNSRDPLSFHKYGFVHGDPVQGIDPTGMYEGLGGLVAGISMQMNMQLGTLVEGSLVALTLKTIGGVGSTLRRVGTQLIASGSIDQGFALYNIGNEILGVTMFTADVVSTGIGAFQLFAAVASVGRLAASNLLSSGSRLQDLSIAMAGQAPKIQWRPNAAGVVRTEAEIIDIARQHGVNVPTDVDFRVDYDLDFLPQDLMEKGARGPNITKITGGTEPRVYWRDFVDARTGKVVFLVHPDALKSDEAIVALVAHEVHEINGLRQMINESGGSMSFSAYIHEVMPGSKYSLHDEAWDIADLFVTQMRGG